MKRQPLATSEILKHFVFVIPPSEELSLLEEKREVESEAELSAIGSAKVKSKHFILTLAGLQMGRKVLTSTWPETGCGAGSQLTEVFSLHSLGTLPEDPT